MADVKQAFVCGWPVNHSRSPMIHRYWLKKYGLSGDYVKYPCEPENFATFVENMAETDFVGGNVTVPHKEAALKLADQPEAEALRLGAANTLWIRDGKIRATNTDGYGFLANLDERAPGWDSPEHRQRGALVLGAGGAARAVIDALQQRNFAKILIANRTIEKAEKLVQQFGPPCSAVGIESIDCLTCDAAVIVNTTSLGMNDGRSPLNLAGFSSDTIVNDIVYTPLITPLLEQARVQKMQAVDGLGMLLHQAVLGFEKWFGTRPEVDAELRQLLLDDLGESQ